MTSNDYSINYQSSKSPAGGGGGSNIILPGFGKSTESDKDNDKKEEGVVITPEPSIVIKTRLLKSDGNPSTQSILNVSGDSNASFETKNFETKIFLNVCMHELISLPSKRKTLDEDGKEAEGWHLPMSLGELRPCYDKNGNVALAADCVMNPRVVNDMHNDSNHLHFVCDLVIQCATRKFSKPSFGGYELDKKYKLPKMKYAGYVDEMTGLPTDPKGSRMEGGSCPVVAKQRVRGSGRSRPIIEELDSTPVASPPAPSSEKLIDSPKPTTRRLSLIPIELFVDDTPLGQFLDGLHSTIGKQFPSNGALQKRMTLSDLKQAEQQNLHSSQLLKVPVPYSWNSSETCHSIIAKCSTSFAADPLPDGIVVEVSAFQLILSSPSHSKTECVLPFPVDSHNVKCVFDSKTKTIEITMPLLESMLQIDQGPDPGTKQWELANAFSRGTNESDNNTMDDSIPASQSNCDQVESENESDNENQALPEDAFHSQDALSRHYLQQQEEERKSKRANHEQMMANDDEDVELIDIKDFRPGGKYFMQELMEQSDQNIQDGDDDEATLRKAEEVLKQSMMDDDAGCLMDHSLGLV